MLRKPASLPAGEYRSHLRFTQQPKSNPPVTDAPKKGLQVKIEALVRLSIPVIIKQGELTVEASIGDLALKRTNETEGELTFNVKRLGTASVFADCHAYYQATPNEPPIEIGQLLGVSVLAPNTTRQGKTKLKLPQPMTWKKGTIIFVAKDADDASVNKRVLGEARLRL